MQPIPDMASASTPRDRLREPRSARGPVWLPWLCAPLFLLLPIGGCGAAAAVLRRPLHATVASDLPLPGPEAPVATVATNMPANR
jgi:hypothetical protein